jgi:hypothetical protein
VLNEYISNWKATTISYCTPCPRRRHT